MNELSIIFSKINIDTRAVLDAAKTKWNFLDFKPGLVGGHCIGVDPYYLTYKAKQLNYSPKVILAGRAINDSMGKVVGKKIIKEIKKRNISVSQAKILVMGITFKENCPDIRNSKVIDLIQYLATKVMAITVSDPEASVKEVKQCYGIKMKSKIPKNIKFDAIIFAVEHKEFKKLTKKNLESNLSSNGFIFDLKRTLPSKLVDINL
jgi:UDP-N-acetyl-D-galactosamine dehydrogenase